MDRGDGVAGARLQLWHPSLNLRWPQTRWGSNQGRAGDSEMFASSWRQSYHDSTPMRQSLATKAGVCRYSGDLSDGTDYLVWSSLTLMKMPMRGHLQGRSTINWFRKGSTLMPEEHRRQWYFTSLVELIRSRAVGDVPSTSIFNYYHCTTRPSMGWRASRW